MDLKALLGLCYVSMMTVGNDLLQRAMAAEREEKEKKALKSVQSFIGSITTALKKEVEELRQFRRRAKLQAQKVKSMDRAAQFFLSSGNPLPYLKEYGSIHDIALFCRELGIDTPPTDSPAYKVPDDFNPEPAGTVED